MRNRAPVRMPWLNMTRMAPSMPGAVADQRDGGEDARRHEAHVAHARVGDELLEVLLHHRDQGAVEDGDHRERSPRGRTSRRRRGTSAGRSAACRTRPSSAARRPGSRTRPSGASTCASGSQVCSGNIGTLMAKATKKARKAQNCRWYGVDLARQLLDVERELTGRGPSRSRPMTMMATSISRLPTSVKRKNLMAA